MNDEIHETEYTVGIGGRRASWEELPAELRQWVETRCGDTVIAASSEPGGFSPGVASRLELANGGSMFFKAVSALANPDSPGPPSPRGRDHDRAARRGPGPAIRGLL